MQGLQEVMTYDAAIQEIEKLMDIKRIFPKQRERLKPAIEAVAEGMQLGLVSIKEDGEIVQTLDKSIDSVSQIVYKARVEPFTMNTALQKVGTNMGAVILEYQKQYTGLPTATLLKLEPADKNIADAITYFFQ